LVVERSRNLSLAIQYENLNDAQMRLANTIVLYDGDPVYITQVGMKEEGDPKDDTFRVYASPLPYAAHRGAKGEMRKFISSKKFDMAPFEMGFMNLNGVAYYCSRLPRRQQRQGLSSGTFSCIPVGAPHVGALRLENVIAQQEFVDCIKGKHPSYADAVRLIERGEAGSVAFARCFALVQDVDMPELVFLYHKKEKVGFLMGDTLKLSKAGKCLREALREAGVRL
jgi:hypothetical protein